NPDDYPTIIQRRVPRQQAGAVGGDDFEHRDLAQRVGGDGHLRGEGEVLELARIGGIFLDFDLSVQNAKIATLGERVEDVFYIT
ncbi:ACT domain-containing protein, partial [Pseudomonas aeruginosa]